MSKNKKIFYGALVVGVVLIGVYFLLLNNCQQCRVSHFWGIGYCDRICLPTPTQQVSTTTDGTAGLPSEVLTEEGWKTYRNEEYGFEIKYPLDFEIGNVFKEEQRITIQIFGMGERRNEWFEVSARADDEIEGWTEEQLIGFYEQLIKLYSERGADVGEYLLDGERAIEVRDENDAVFIIAIRNNITYTIGISHNSLLEKTYFDKIISTFRFID